MLEIQCQGKTKSGERCKKAATAFSDFCVQHRAAINAAEVVELPPMSERVVGLLEYDPSAPNVVERRDADGNVSNVWVGPLDTLIPVNEFGAMPEGWVEVGTTTEGVKVVEAAAEPVVEIDNPFMRGREPYISKRCPEKGCGQLRDHEGRHDMNIRRKPKVRHGYRR